MKTKHYLYCGLLALSAVSCTDVREYQKQFLKDQDMQLGAGPLDKFDLNTENYREGGTGANGGSAGGGCGCN